MSELYDNNLLESGFYSKGVVKQIIAGEGVTITGTPDSPIISVGSVVADINFTDITGTATVGQIPNLPASKITSGTFAIARIPTGITASTVALGNHNHDINNLTGIPTGTSGQVLGFGTDGEIVAISLPEEITLETGNFFVGGVSGNMQRKILPSDIGLTVNNTVAVRNSNGSLQGWAMSSAAANSTILVRTPTGQGKFSPAVALNDAVVLSQLNSSLENKVDKEVGKGLSEDNFTTAEKNKLAGLEDVHYKGWFTSLASLEAAYPAPEEGAHALVDDPSGSLVYIWKTDVEPPLWDPRVGEGTEMTAAQVKTYYESNPDTNTFTDSEKSKLASMTSLFTSALKTMYDNAVSWITTNGQLLIDHLSDFSNPHQVTKSQVGLSNVDNTSDLEKPLSNPVKQILEDNGVTPLLSRTTVNKTLVLDYEDRTEYIERITVNGYAITAQTFRTYTTAHRFPTGIRISSADTLNISNTSSSSSTTLAVDQNANGDIIFRLANYSTASLSLYMTVFIKAVFYK